MTGFEGATISFSSTFVARQRDHTRSSCRLDNHVVASAQRNSLGIEVINLPAGLKRIPNVNHSIPPIKRSKDSTANVKLALTLKSRRMRAVSLRILPNVGNHAAAVLSYFCEVLLFSLDSSSCHNDGKNVLKNFRSVSTTRLFSSLYSSKILLIKARIFFPSKIVAENPNKRCPVDKRFSSSSEKLREMIWQRKPLSEVIASAAQSAKHNVVGGSSKVQQRIGGFLAHVLGAFDQNDLTSPSKGLNIVAAVKLNHVDGNDSVFRHHVEKVRHTPGFKFSASLAITASLPFFS